jgi:hypothetical protein
MLEFKLGDTWIDLSSNRKMQKFKNFICVVPQDYDGGTSFGCPLCGVLFADQIDLMTFRQYGCCSECSYVWAQPNIEKWNDGWRPNRDQVQKNY